MADNMRGDYHEVVVVIAGREGIQRLQIENKREAIRQAARLLKEGGFGSAAAVTLIIPREGKEDKRVLIHQAHAKLTATGKVKVTAEEL